LPSTRVNGRNRLLTIEHPVSFFVFDLLRRDYQDLSVEPRTARRAALDPSTWPKPRRMWSGDGEMVADPLEQLA
jgi:ATP-dependent DNA ligase